MPASDVSDLRDVVDAINKLCDTMKTSYDAVPDADGKVEACVPGSRIDPVDDRGRIDGSSPAFVRKPSTVNVEFESSYATSTMPDEKSIDESESSVVTCRKAIEVSDSVSSEKVARTLDSLPVSDAKSTAVFDQKSTETQEGEPMTDRTVDSESTLVSDSDRTDPTTVEQMYCDPTSEMYYTASSEASLLSDLEFPDRQSEDSDRERDDRNGVMAGHVAAMRERFESMTRTNTPCPELMRSVSPSFEVFRNFSASPDSLDKS